MGNKEKLQKFWSRYLELSDELREAKDWSSLSPQAKRLVLGLVGYVVFEKAFTWHHVYHTPEKRLRGSLVCCHLVSGRRGPTRILPFRAEAEGEEAEAQKLEVVD